MGRRREDWTRGEPPEVCLQYMQTVQNVDVEWLGPLP